MSKLTASLRRTVAEAPDRLAIQRGEQRLSYAELRDAIEALGVHIGNVAGNRVLLLLPDTLSSYLCHLAFFIEGAILAPVSVRSTTAQIDRLCKRLQPHLIVTNRPLFSRHKDVLESLPHLLIDSSPAGEPGQFAYSGSVASGTVRATRPQADMRLLIFTSGSTGEPKGVCLSEQNILAAAEMMVSFLGLSAERKSLVTVPLYDYYGFIQIYGHILAGCGYILGESPTFPTPLLRRIVTEQVTDLVLVPHTLRQLLSLPGGGCADAFRALRYMTSSSDFLTSPLLDATFAFNPELEIFNIYGLTEAGRAACRRIGANAPPSHSIGKPSPGAEIILDSPEGEIGEIVLRGPNVMLGYMTEVRDDEIHFTPCAEVRSGDLARRAENGEIVLLGRHDHMINIMGNKIHPAEIETLALQVPGVLDACASVRRDGDGEAVVILDVVPRPESYDGEALAKHLARHLRRVFVPRRINRVPRVERTEIGSKIVRGEVGV